MHAAYIIGLFVLLGTTAFLGNVDNDLNLQNKFNSWKIKFGKIYRSQEEEVFRLGVYVQNLAKIMKLNLANSGVAFGETQFMDLTDEEFKQGYLTLKVGQRNGAKRTGYYSVEEDIDWTTKGAVTPVKDQGECGGCYAFSAVANMESANFLFGTKSLVSLSEQQVLDCSTSYGNQGCDGGWTDYAFEYIIDHGITTEDAYPYTGTSGKCKKQGGSYQAKAYVDLKDCTELANALMIEPVSVAVDASDWAYYTGGILSKCGTTINHAVEVVGMTTQYWKIKNSWSASWGEQGYIRIASGDTCGVCEYASYLTL